MTQVLKWLSARNMRLGLIAVPWLLAAAYLLIFAADRYVSESVISVRDNGEVSIGVDALSSLFGTTGSGSREDEFILEAHILSMDMLRQLDEKLALRQSFSAPRGDPIFRLSPNATREEFLRYYRNRVEVTVDDQSGLIFVRTQGFTPEIAAAINQELVAMSERFINESSHRLAREQMEFAEGELHRVRADLDAARSAVLSFQKKHGVIDPIAQITANTGLTAELRATLARQEAALRSLLAYLNDDAHEVQSLRAQIAGTQAQLEAESLRGLSNVEGASLNVLAGEYQELLAELQYAQDRYQLGLTGLESARIESTRKLKSLVLVESPVLPESPEYPSRLYILFALLLGLGLLYGIARLVVATIEDHQQ